MICKEIADKEDRDIFGGRLGEYKYYDMDRVTAKDIKHINLDKKI